MSPHDYQAWLADYLKTHGAVAGTVHLRGDEVLELVASVNIPPKVVEVTGRIPHGKGMAGLAWSRDEAVQTCNLKDDASGDVRPGAKAVDANAAVALPVHDSSGQVRAVVGVAFMGAREVQAEELAKLASAAEALPASIE